MSDRTAPGSVRCAIYTRKSSEEGLDQRFTSLEAQREACEAFVRSQAEQGWTALATAYDDGGYSGGTLARPAIQRLLTDIAAGTVQIVVVYKVDRLTRALADFAKLVERFDAHGVSFVSVTQPFNTTTSMGRLTLNVLLSFAQFEREVTGERIRDKLAASKRKGLWMGGVPPIGYTAHERALVVDAPEAARVRKIYRTYLKLGCVRRLKETLDRRGWMTPKRRTRRAGAGGHRPFSRGHLYRILRNPIYVGKIVHHGEESAGQHTGIVDPKMWAAVQAQLAAHRQTRRTRTTAAAPSLLAGLVFDASGARLTPTHATKGTRRYRYYVARSLHEGGRASAPDALRLPAHGLEESVVHAVVRFLTDDAQVGAALGAIEARTMRARLVEAHRLAIALSATQEPAAVDAASRIALVQRLVARITVEATTLVIVVRLAALRGPAGDAAATDTAATDDGEIDAGTTELDVPLAWTRRGRVIRLILPSTGIPATPEPDATLVALLAKAEEWFARLASGRCDSIQAIAREEHVSSSYVTRVIYCAFLAPDLVTRIAAGDAPATLTATRLLSAVPLPADWGEQRARLGWPR